MTTTRPITSRCQRRLPDIPRREPDEVTAFDHLYQHGNTHYLVQHLISEGADPDRLLVTADRWIVEDLASFRVRARYPDLLVTFEVDLAAYRASNGYVIAEQGKPPDFVIEVASASTGHVDVGAKRGDYEAFGIGEYWRFDETGEYHGARLAGDRLVAGRYAPLPIEELADGVLEGYSEALNLNLRWQDGVLGWHDPATGRHIATFEDERARADAERLERVSSDRRAEREQRRADAAEARIRALESELRRWRRD